jgi:NADPH2:quinone reductase
MNENGSAANALVVREFGGPESIEMVEVPVPEPARGQVRVRVQASSVNPIDLSTRSGALAAGGLVPVARLTSLGWDVAGTVEEVGTRDSRFQPGQTVVGLRDLISTVPGAHASHVVLDESALAPAPGSVGWAAAATLPLNALTADRSLALAGVGPGDTLLVTGAAGAVGGFVLELAKLRGVRTIAVAARADEEAVRALGARDFVPRADLLAQAVRELAPGGVDAVIDAATIGIAAHEALRGGGTFVALVRPFAPPPIRGTTVVVQEVFADGARLAELVGLVDAGLLTLRVAAELPLADAGRAHEMVAAGGLRGRVVLIP